MTEEKKLRTKFELLPDGFEIVLESTGAEEHANWRPEAKATFTVNTPGVIEVTGVDCILESGVGRKIPLNHELAKALSSALIDLVNYSQKALDTVQNAQFICPDCEHVTNLPLEKLPEDHPCRDCGEPEWKNLSRRGS